MKVGIIVGLMLWGAIAQAQLNEAQRNCVDSLNKDGVALAKAQSKENLRCLKAAGAGKLGVMTPLVCLGDDPKDKVFNKVVKITLDAATKCSDLPPFGFSSANDISFAPRLAMRALISDVFGTFNTAVIACDTSKAQCKCQRKLEDKVEKVAVLMLKTAAKSRKAIGETCTDATDCARCMTDSMLEGSLAFESLTGGKIDKAQTKLNDTISDCDANNATTGSFPGACTALSGTALRDCLLELVRCRACQIFNDMDAFTIVCDTFDNGAADMSCADSILP